jgi:hypothetical protein
LVSPWYAFYYSFCLHFTNISASLKLASRDALV